MRTCLFKLSLNKTTVSIRFEGQLIYGLHIRRLTHPRRPRGGQSDREKRCDESSARLTAPGSQRMASYFDLFNA